MKVSLNWAQFYSNVDIKSIGVDSLVKKIGLQLGAVEEVMDWGSRYDDVVVVKVVAREKHPNADKLSVCLVDDDGAVKGAKRNADKLVQVVCGAPNVRAGMYAAWLPPGSTVPSSIGKDPFVLGARELRGVVSNGMLASGHELGINDDHSGIVELNLNELAKGTKPGSSIKDALWLDGEVVIDCENKMFTHRPDCFGILGVARELAGIQHKAFKSPDWYVKDPEFKSAKDLPLEVRVEDAKLVPRFMAVAVKNVQVKPSPLHIQFDLMRVGIKPVNNIVDTTNYLMHLTGQPLHAYDYDKVKAMSGSVPTLIARIAKKGDSIKLLNGKTIEPEAPTVVIATDKQVIGVGGVMGGADTEVDSNTKNIILEVATFDMYNIRRTSMKYGLFTDAVTRFNKGQSPLQNNRVLGRALHDIRELAGGQQASPVLDEKKFREKRSVYPPVLVETKFVNNRLGTDLSRGDMAGLLRNVEFEVDESDDAIEVSAPFWRTDIEIAEDVVEEIGRLYGYDRLPAVLPKRSIKPAKVNEALAFKQLIRTKLRASGANELLTYSFVHGKLMDAVGQNIKNAYQLSNALSPDLQYYRMSILPSLLDKVRPNIKAGFSSFGLFEIGVVHNKDQVDKTNLPIEEKRLGFVFAADNKLATTNYSGSPYYQAKTYLDYIAQQLNTDIVLELRDKEPRTEVGKAAMAPFEPARAAYIKDAVGNLLGEIGEIKPGVKKALKLPDFVAGFELDIEALLSASKNSARYHPLSRFPRTEQDITLAVPPKTTYAEILSCVQKSINAASTEHGYAAEAQAIDSYQLGKQKLHQTFRIKLAHPDRTMTTNEVNNLLDDIATAAKREIQAERV